MHSSLKPRAAAMLVAAACALPAAACSLAAPDPQVLKQMMAREIAFRLAIPVEQVPLDDITMPQLHRPLEQEADCSGLAAWHHTSGFRIEVAQQRTFATMAKPPSAGGAGVRARKRYASGFYRRWPGAGVRLDYWRATKPKLPPELDYSGYIRWPQHPTEREFAAAARSESAPQRWPQYPSDPAYMAPPPRWTTLSVLPADSQQGFCRYEGVAAVLGYDASSPVAVNFTQRCD